MSDFITCHPRVGGDLCAPSSLSLVLREIPACAGMTVLGEGHA